MTVSDDRWSCPHCPTTWAVSPLVPWNERRPALRVIAQRHVCHAQRRTS